MFLLLLRVDKFNENGKKILKRIMKPIVDNTNIPPIRPTQKAIFGGMESNTFCIRMLIINLIDLSNIII